jgi:hypothetical protein
MIHTFGCSFTKWYWHTWSDWLQEYSNDAVTNHGWPGISNDTIYWEILNSLNSISSTDTVYVMFTGNNRQSVWYDNEWITKQDCQGYFPNQKGLLEFSNKPWVGMHRTHPDYEQSLTHMLINQFNIIYQTQLLLEKIGCKFNFMFWQNPWHDVRPKQQPSWEAVWPIKSILEGQALKTAKRLIATIVPLANLIKLIDWDNFILGPGDPNDPLTYQGLWEFKTVKQTSQQYIEYAHASDPHPDTVVHHDFVVEVILNNTVKPLLFDQAEQFANRCKNIKISLPRTMLVADKFTNQIEKVY